MAFEPGLDDDDEELQGTPEPIDTVAGPMTPRQQVMQRISSVRNPSSTLSEGPGDDPQNDAAIQFARNTALTSGLGRALNTLAAGTGFKPDDSAYDALDKQPNIAMQALNRSAAVKRAIAARDAAALEKARQQKNFDTSIDLKRQELGARRQEREDALAEKRDKANGDQFKVAGFGKRLAQAEDVFSGLEKAGYDRSGLMGTLQAKVPGFMQPAEAQEQEQAERNFVNAVLRRESGAAIAPSEFDSAAKQYFPRSGDSPEVLAQKKANRAQVIASMQAESGPAWEKIPTIAAAPVAKRGSDGLVPEAQAGGRGPKIGTVEDGYIYTGGDPQDPHSWVKAK